jgi:drug/metabolite transporter (DMT)-like permease
VAANALGFDYVATSSWIDRFAASAFDRWQGTPPIGGVPHDEQATPDPERTTRATFPKDQKIAQLTPMGTQKAVAARDLDANILGETSAVATSVLWTISSIFFTSAGRKIGSLSVNAYRTIMAIGFLVVAHAILLGTFLPMASKEQWLWMGASGVVGLGIGDAGLFAAYVTIGPRRSVLVMALAPIFASVGAFLMLGEILPELAVIGIAITLAGVVVVILEEEERSGETPVPKKLKTYGVFFALIGALGQGIGLVFAKKGIDFNPQVTLNPISATLMRLILGALFVWIVTIAARRFPELSRAVRNREGMTNTAAGALIGPFLGITLSMIAVTYTETGVAQTLKSQMPVLIIPTVWILYRQRTSWRGITGAAIAVVGVAILFLT